MSDQIAPEPPAAAPATPAAATPKLPKYYGFSAYSSALVKWWRSIFTFAILIVANSALQAALMFPYDMEPIGPLFWLKAALSGIVFFVVWGVMISAAISLYGGRVGVRAAFGWFRSRWLNFVVWTIAWIVGCTILSLFQFWPGLLAVFITFYIPFAAADGQRNAFVANFKAIASRPVRYFFTALLTGILIFGGLYLIGGLTLFSSPNTHGVLVAWLFLGLIGSWMTVAWGLLYRSTKVGSPEGSQATASAQATTATAD